MKTSKILLLSVCSLAFSTVVHAGNKKGDFYVSPMLGGITFDGRQELKPSPVFGARLGYNLTKWLGIEALFDYAESNSEIINTRLRMHRYGGEILLHAFPDNKFVPYIAGGFSAHSMTGKSSFANSETKGSPSYGLGAKYFVTEDVAWRGDVRHIIYDYGRTSHAIEYTMGLYIPFGRTSAALKLADPPQPPEPAKKVAEVIPPPAPVAKLNANPNEIVKGNSSTLNWSSVNADACDIQPGIGDVKPQGSMPVKPDDTTMYALTCKGDGGTARSVASVTVSLPPEVPKPVVSPAAERFCNKPAILRVYFDTDKYNIKPQYHGELKTVGDFLKEFPKSTGEIAGHTDSTHTREYNQKLSERRANSIKKYIVKNFGIASERIKAVGYGEDRPVATNKTKEGKAQNRRIEANFVCD